MISSVQPGAMDAVRHFAARVTTPLLHGKEGEFALPIGTATFFSMGERLFLVTAAHNFQDSGLSGFAVPENKDKGAHVSIDGQLCWPTPPHVDRIDVAAVVLSPACAQRVKNAGWHSIKLDQVQPASERGNFVLCGYPSIRVHRRGETLACVLVTAFTERLDEAPRNLKTPADPEVDLFFRYDSVATDTDGEEVTTPNLKGASGANVWEYVEPPSGQLWTGEKAIKAVGVQSSAMDGEWFRAKSWGAVLSAIKAAHPDLAPEIDKRLTRRD